LPESPELPKLPKFETEDLRSRGLESEFHAIGQCLSLENLRQLLLACDFSLSLLESILRFGSNNHGSGIVFRSPGSPTRPLLARWGGGHARSRCDHVRSRRLLTPPKALPKSHSLFNLVFRWQGYSLFPAFLFPIP